ncbi:hypothetical protein Tco_0254145, partial [Tanacetum coccineum]
NRRVGVRDLRSILQKKSANGSLSGGVRDLREKLSGYSQSAVSAPAMAKPVSESSRPARRSVLAEAVVVETRNVSGPASKRKIHEVHHVYSLCVQMYVSFPLAGFDTSESATHCMHIYLKESTADQISTHKLSLAIFTNPFVGYLK